MAGTPRLAVPLQLSVTEEPRVVMVDARGSSVIVNSGSGERWRLGVCED